MTTWFEDDNGDKIVEIKVKTSPDNVLPMEFKSYFLRIAREVPDEIAQEMIDKEIERLHNSMENWKNWREYRERIEYGKG